ncbi:hypothetical protein [Arthrobacter sp. MYb227]|uniref:hypothetical protein n=1 Tax=Arthrobacter sp. MYb227 TaxID=1848601 RepID=UPI0011B01931|nr:hypothetical protein [Arthrobacter sp. MYb227]
MMIDSLLLTKIESDKMTSDARRSLFLSMNRPQYVSVPEGFISSLAWKLFDFNEPPTLGAGKKLALMYKVEKDTKSTNLSVTTTAPKGHDGHSAFGEVLKNSGIGPYNLDPILIATAVSNSITGIRAEKSTMQAASPLTPGIALLQNMRGVQKSQSPPDLAGIIETLYRLGAPHGSQSQSGVAERWLDASNRRLGADALLAAMDKSAKENLLLSGVKLKVTELPSEFIGGLFPNTPFTWFARIWDRLTGPDWVDALPARVWVDWATTVLRLAYGMGFLWEAAWYETFARRILRGEPFTREQLLKEIPAALPWKSSRSTQSVRDVASVLLRRVHVGGAVRKLVDSWLSTAETKSGNLLATETAITRMMGDGDFRKQLTVALGGQMKAAPNTWEAVKYALLTRDVAGPFADYYGMLRQNGRFLTVSPGTEWIAVVASLSCDRPGGEANVGRLMGDLHEMGLNPQLSDVIELLERAGLARGSADADQGVLIKSAF